MAYEVFCKRVGHLVKSAGCKASFSHEDGRHIARCSNGVTIIGNTIAHRVFVQWGCGHTAFVTI